VNLFKDIIAWVCLVAVALVAVAFLLGFLLVCLGAGLHLNICVDIGGWLVLASMGGGLLLSVVMIVIEVWIHFTSPPFNPSDYSDLE